jgi:hypothetical protein
MGQKLCSARNVWGAGSVAHLSAIRFQSGEDDVGAGVQLGDGGREWQRWRSPSRQPAEVTRARQQCRVHGRMFLQRLPGPSAATDGEVSPLTADRRDEGSSTAIDHSNSSSSRMKSSSDHPASILATARCSISAKPLRRWRPSSVSDGRQSPSCPS